MSIPAIQAVSTAVQLYFDALYECNLAAFDAVFHPTSSLFDATGGQFTAMPIADYRAVIEKRVSPRSRGQARADELITIDLLSEDAAVTKVRLRIHDKVFDDHLSWVRVGDRFMIVAKVWHDATAQLRSCE